ncbi:hypothetical protein [Desulfonatronum parangueonense]
MREHNRCQVVKHRTWVEPGIGGEKIVNAHIIKGNIFVSTEQTDAVAGLSIVIGVGIGVNIGIGIGIGVGIGAI